MTAAGDAPAYPWGEHGIALGGLTKRELFAAMAMQGLASVPYNGDDTEHTICPPMDAKRAVAYADALLAALQTEGTP